MSNQEKAEQLKKLVDDILHKMTFDNFEIKISSEAGPDGENLTLNIETPESNLLIGQFGATLKALQHIVRVVARRRADEKVKFLLDVNGYLRQKTSSLSEIAQAAARQAISEKKPVVLRPMSAYERRIVHLELLDSENVKTESIGEGEERRVVVRPVGDLERLGTKNPKTL